MNCLPMRDCMSMSYVVGHKQASSDLFQCYYVWSDSTDNIFMWLCVVQYAMQSRWFIIESGFKTLA
jgi:hypothetical protein